MTALPLPTRGFMRSMAKGRGRAETIRTLFAERCSVAEIAQHLRIGISEVRRTLHRPVFHAQPLSRAA